MRAQKQKLEAKQATGNKEEIFSSYQIYFIIQFHFIQVTKYTHFQNENE